MQQGMMQRFGSLVHKELVWQTKTQTVVSFPINFKSFKGEVVFSLYEICLSS